MRAVVGASNLRALFVVAAVAIGATACAEPKPNTPPVPSSAPREPGEAAVEASATPPAAPTEAPPARTWVDAVRMERWAEAATLMDALAADELSRPAVRYARARVALALGDAARAAPLLAGLERELPLLAEDIQRWRAEAAAEVGPWAEAAAWFGRSRKARDLTRAAEAVHRGGDLKGARRAIDKAVTAAQKAKHLGDEARARGVRARLAKEAGSLPAALADQRWIVTKAPTAPEAVEARAALAEAKQVLTVAEATGAIQAMIDGGQPREALAAIAELEQRPGAPRGELLHARAMALHKARDYPACAAAFEVAAGAKTGREVEALFYGARCLSRADRDEEAITKYAEVVRRFRTGPFAERAAFYGARLLLLGGKFKEAVVAYDRYHASFPRGENRREAEYERALALLSAGDHGVARKALGFIAEKAANDEEPRIRELEAVAALRGGDRDGAVRLFTSIAREHPLTYAGMVSRARLLSVGAPQPPLIEPAPQRPAMALDARLPEVPALLASVGLDGDAEAWLAGREQDAASAHPGRESEALCAMYEKLSRARRRYRVGNAAVSYKTLMRAPSEAERWTWECIYPRPYAPAVRALEKEHSIPSGLVHAVMRQESAFDPRVVSPASAVGLMQLMPKTAELACGELSIPYDAAELTSPEANLRLGAFYLGKLLRTFQGNVALAAASYNAGPRAVSHWLAVGSDMELDLFVARIPYEETRTYVARVLGNFARYQWLAGGDAAVTPLDLKIPADARCEADAY